MNDVQSLLLNTIGAALFGQKAPAVADNLILPLVSESKAQAVFPLLFSVLDSQFQEKLKAEQYAQLSEEFFHYAIAGTQNFAEHTELHELMTEHAIPYAVMKGFASSMYYPEPALRSVGDVDFLVKPEDLEKTRELLESIGFSVDHGEEESSKHIAFTRPPMSVWEMHRTVNGIPGGEVGERIQAEMDRVIETADSVNRDDVICMAPDKLHHGLILLLHTASHLTGEGVGLRHLCDWAVFASSFSDREFREIFEKKLKSFGLWRFAQVLTVLGINYLGAPNRVWAIQAMEGQAVNDGILSGLMQDILNGGNFGAKDQNRYREIKYISDRGDRTVSSGGIVRQGFKTMNQKVRANHPFLHKHKILLPLGYLAESGRYAGLLITGKRKSSGTRQMLKEAADRKKLYASLALFR